MYFCQVPSKSRSVGTAALFSLAHIHLPASPSSRKICPAPANLHRHPHPCCYLPIGACSNPSTETKRCFTPAGLCLLLSHQHTHLDHPNMITQPAIFHKVIMAATNFSTLEQALLPWESKFEKQKNYRRSDSDLSLSFPWVTERCSIIGILMIGKREQVIAVQTSEEYGVCLGALSKMYFLQQKAQWGIAWHLFLLWFFLLHKSPQKALLILSK